MRFVDNQAKVHLSYKQGQYHFSLQGQKYHLPTLEKVHEFFFTETKLDTVKLCYQGKKSYVHFSIDEIETFTSKKALRRTLSQESNGAWIEKRDGKKKYFVDNGWLFSSIKKVSKEEYQNRPEEGSTFQKVLGVALGVFAIAPAAVEIARKVPVSTNEVGMGLIALHHRSPLLAFVGCSLWSSTVYAQAVGTEFQVNTYILNGQGNPRAALMKNGGFIVTWASSGGQDGDSAGIYAQIFEASGIRHNSEFPVNTYSISSQESPVVAVLSDGKFVISWQSYMQDGDLYGIYAQIFGINGTKYGSEFRVNTYTINDQKLPTIASLKNGSFVIAWQSNGQDGSANGIYAKAYDNEGLVIEAEFKVNTNILSEQEAPSIIPLNDEGFVIFWHGSNQSTSSYEVYGQRYDSRRVPVNGEHQINTYTTNSQDRPTCALLKKGNFVVTWTSYGGQDGSFGGIFAQQFDANGAKNGTEFQVNSYVTSDQTRQSITALNDEGFAITWISSQQDGDGDGVYAQRFDSSGTKNGVEFQVNNYTMRNQNYPSIISLDDGGFVIIWQSQEQDGSGGGIFGQRYNSNGISVPLITVSNSSTSNMPTSSFSVSLTSPSIANSQSNNLTISLTTSPSPASSTPTPSFSASITAPTSANSQGSNPIASISAIATSILSTSSGVSSAQMGSSTNTNPQQTTTPIPSSSSQNPTQTIPSPPSQFSASINPVIPTPSPISSPISPFPAPSVLLTSNPVSSSSPDSSSEVNCDQDCVASYTDLIGGVLGGVASIITIAATVFGVHKWRKKKTKEKEDIELQLQQPQPLAPEVQNLFGGYPKAQKYWNVVSPQEQALIKAVATLLQQANPALSQSQANPNSAPVDLSVSSSSEEIVPQNPPINLDRKILGGDQYQYEYEIIPIITQREANQLLRQTGYRVHFGGQAQVQKIQLGSGHFGEVSIAQIRGEHRFLAVKEIQGEGNIKQSRKEGRYQRELTDGPNVLPIYDSIESEGKLYHFIQLAGFGDGKQLKDKIINLDFQLLKSIIMKTALGLCNGLLHMHGKNLYHFDLKPDNILFDQVGEVYISDFGHTQRERNGRTSPPYGDLTYASPEAKTQYRNLQNRRPIQPIDAEKQDAWGLGITLVEMLGLFNGNRDDQFETTILETLNQGNPQEGDLEYLILGLLQPDPAHRWTVQNAHDYLTQNVVTIGNEAREAIFDMLARIPDNDLD